MERKAAGRRGGEYMKRSPSELALQEVIKTTTPNNDATVIKDERAGGEIGRATRDNGNNNNANNNNTFFASDLDGLLGDFYSSDLNFAFKSTLDILNGGVSDSPFWSHNGCNPKESCVSAPIDSQSSICVGSPISANNKPKIRDNQVKGTNTTSGSSPEQSDDEDGETETGPCERSTNPADLRRIRRKVSNRESARRSRRRKQAHLADLEMQVDQITGENASLYKQLLDASQQFRDADTNNRVLKSDVEALRAKVKLAEDMVARGSISGRLNLLLQNHINSPQPLGAHNSLRRTANVSPSITVRADDASRVPGGITVPGQNTGLGIGNTGINDSNLKNGVMSEPVNCVSEMWH